MSDGLITRIGRWIDTKWESKATESQLDAVRQLVQERWNNLENAQIKDKLELQQELKETVADTISALAENDKAIIKTMDDHIFKLRQAITDIEIVAKSPEVYEKEIADLKTRIERVELYTGVTRKVDTTKAPVAKSAFQM